MINSLNFNFILSSIILPSNQYCLTVNECKSIYGWSWNGTCVMECPIGYNKYSDGEDITCEVTRNPNHVRKVGKYVVLALLVSVENVLSEYKNAFVYITQRRYRDTVHFQFRHARRLVSSVTYCHSKKTVKCDRN